MVKRLEIDSVNLVQLHFESTQKRLPRGSKLYLHSERLYSLNKVADESIDLMTELMFRLKYDTSLAVILFEHLPGLSWLYEINNGWLMNVIDKINPSQLPKVLLGLSYRS